ncbi:PREDICTED: lysosomal Pro-X carboxypeptidase isoform X2 [Nicotiana attenuata]|uniref:lysosomal Pro-X carboxypeptidase isoform X2 n=1 Tax=Nicotiana attenuata TaxID=49451 RepID=UPI000905A245|nr:PREDICTED: lysosomal Pro-X carboxypeptidase isoform X2 [Nicotiana attenuata]
MAFSSSYFSFIFLILLFIISVAVGEIKPVYLPGTYQSSLKKQNVKSKIPFKTHYFPQNLDHFTFLPKSSKVFKQKYLINDKYWQKGGPIFVYTGNEGNIDWFAANTGFMLDIAPKFHALLVFIEHRFYGDSMPFGKKSYKSPKTLGYLNSQQALADYAVLIRSLKQNLSSESSPVVVFGGSYGGMLASWFRLKYPHIAIGAVASSAPILQFDKITPWSSFYDAVSQDFKEASLNCYKVIKGSWTELDALSKHEEGLTKVSKLFKTCKGLHSVYSARDWLWEAFVYTAMVNYPTEANFMMPLPAYPVQEACTEMVMPMTCSNESMFPPSSYSYKEFTEDCKKKYGVEPRPHWITTEFVGYRIEQVLKRFGSNMIFSNGMQDPWSRGGVLKNISASIVALVTQKGAHHVDFRSKTKNDPDWLIMQRKQEVAIIRKWLEEYYRDLKQN